MRTIKSNNFDRVRADDRSSRKSSDDTGNNDGKHKKHKEVSNREDNGPHQHGNGPRDGNSRKTHRNPFRTDRGATDETSKPGPDVVILRASSTPAAAQSVSFADTTAEDTAKRPMDSRRDRRAARKEARHARFEAIRTAQRRGEGDADVKIVADRGNGKAPVALSTSGVSNSTPEEQRKSANVTAAARRASHDSSSGGEHSRDHSKAKRDQRIRNKVSGTDEMIMFRINVYFYSISGSSDTTNLPAGSSSAWCRHVGQDRRSGGWCRCVVWHGQ